MVLTTRYSTFTRTKYIFRNSNFIYTRFLNFGRRHKTLDLKSNLKLNSLLQTLKKDGIVITNVKEIFGEQEGTEYLQSFVNWITANESNLAQHDIKKFLYSYFGKNPDSKVLDFSNPFFSFFLSKEILEFATSYLRYIPQLNDVMIEKTVPVGNSSARQSQNWHRDPQEKRTLKIFLYLNEVKMTSGPFIYIKGSSPTSKGKYSKLAPQVLPGGSYPEEKMINQNVNKSDLVTAIGSPGTIIFCDTAGLHRGGLATNDERIMATAFYPSIRYTHGRGYTLSSQISAETVADNELVRKALVL